jgi:N-(2-amino-2-carboxyethyl)-L-glutamate synthase
MRFEGILSCIGNTPLIELCKIQPKAIRVFAKLEGLNPGGSLKDRPALEIIRRGVAEEKIGQGTLVVEASSGNMGIGLAQICRYLGLRFICVIDHKTTPQNVSLLRAYGAEVEFVDKPDPAIGDVLQARINRARQIAESTVNSFWVNQYANQYNALAHQETMEEIVNGLDGKVDYLFCAASSCGTLRGCADYCQRNRLHTKIYAADAVGSVIFSGCQGKRLIPGHGAGIRPGLYRDGLAHRYVQVEDLDAVLGCRRLLAREGLFVGGSSGATLMALEQVQDEIFEGANCALIFPDRGERYLETIFSDQWVQEQFGVRLDELDILQQGKLSKAVVS